jgi:hypothetical protein
MMIKSTGSGGSESCVLDTAITGYAFQLTAQDLKCETDAAVEMPWGEVVSGQRRSGGRG